MKQIARIRAHPKVVALSLIDQDPGQPRKVFNEESIGELAANIDANGLVHPIYLRKHPEKPGRFLIVAGERRTRALRLLGVEEFEFLIVEEGMKPYVISMIENSHREDLNPMDEAESYRECMEREGMSVAEISKVTGKHFTEIHLSLRFLKLAPEVQQLIREGKLTKRKSLHQLVQFKELALQLRLAQALMRGEDPPEIAELMSKTTVRGDDLIIARLPRNGKGLIHRMLDYRRRTHTGGFAVEAFLKLTQEEQLRGWKEFTPATRANFVSHLEKHARLLLRLKQLMDTLPATAEPTLPLPPPSEYPPAPFQRQPSVSKTKTAPSSLEVPLSHQPAKSPQKDDRIPLPKLPPLLPALKPTEDEMAAALKLMDFLEQRLGQTSQLLGKRYLGEVLTNGHVLGPKEVQDLATRAFRAIRDAWDRPTKKRAPDSAFALKVARFKHGCSNNPFALVLQEIEKTDASPDPIYLKGLY